MSQFIDIVTAEPSSDDVASDDFRGAMIKHFQQRSPPIEAANRSESVSSMEEHSSQADEKAAVRILAQQDDCQLKFSLHSSGNNRDHGRMSSCSNSDTTSRSYSPMAACELSGPQQISSAARRQDCGRAFVLQQERLEVYKQQQEEQQHKAKQPREQQPPNEEPANQSGEHVKHVDLFGYKIVALTINDKDRLCLAQISNTLLKDFSYNEIHNRRVALGITCVQCTPIQLELLRRAGAMPSSSRRCGMITMREAERLCRSFLAEEQPPELPENFHFSVAHRVNYGCKGRFIPARYISSRAKCIECFYCGDFYSPNKFIFHSHKQPFATDCNPPDSPNINSWRKHIDLDWAQEHSQEIKYAWEDVKSLFNGGTRRRMPQAPGSAAASSADGSAAGCSDVAATRSQQRATDQEHDELIVNVEDDLHGGEEAPKEPKAGKLPASLSIGERRKMPMSWPQQAPQRRADSLQQHRAPQQSSKGQQSFGCLSSAHQSSTATKRPTQCPAGQQGGKKFAAANGNSAPKMSSKSREFNIAGGRQSPATTTCGLNQQQQSLLNNDMLLATRLQQRPGEQAAEKAAHIGAVGYTAHQQQGIANNPASFIYNQLYSQLIQSHHQRPHQTQLANIDAQLALRHQIWSSLLANIQQQAHPASTAAPTLLNPGLGLMQQMPIAYNLNAATQQSSQQAVGTSCPQQQTISSQTNPGEQTTTTSSLAAMRNFNLNQPNFPMHMYSPQTVESLFGDDTSMK